MASNSLPFLIEFKFEFKTKSASRVRVEFFIVNFASSSSVIFIEFTLSSSSFHWVYAWPVLGRFDRFYQIGPRTLKGPRTSRGPLLYYEAQNRGKCRKLNQCLIWTISPKLDKKNRQIGSFYNQALVKKKLMQLFDRVGLQFARKYLYRVLGGLHFIFCGSFLASI